MNIYLVNNQDGETNLKSSTGYVYFNRNSSMQSSSLDFLR